MSTRPEPAAAPPDEPALTLDELIRGRIRVWQPRAGYRVNVDSLLLAWFVGEPPYQRVADLGAGVGVVGLALAVRDPAARVTLAELQPASVRLAEKNAAENQVAARTRVVQVDLADERAARALLPGASFERVVSCPPYFTVRAGPPVPEKTEAIARHELRLRLPELVRAARRLLVPGGQAFLVFPSERLVELLGALAGEGLTPTRMRLVHPRPGQPANRVLVQAHKGSRAGLSIEPPLWLRDDGGGYGPEARQALGEG
jgi:tRNA1Val (adenine37-N6)-methyltransferase